MLIYLTLYVMISYMKNKGFKNQLAERIRTTRNNLGYSQEEIAKKMGFHRPTLSQIEHGEREVSAEDLTKLAMIFGVTIKDLIGDNKSPPPEKENKPRSETDIVVTFLRHGEAIDDVYDQYGGWADPEMSPRGINKAFQIVSNLKNNGVNFEIIYCSPLKRARQLAEVIGRELRTDVKVMQYLKERNTYGLLSGINKSIAKKRFPELVDAYETGKYVLGSERENDFLNRIPLIFDYIRQQKYKNICCVTHGKVLTAIIKKILGMTPSDLAEGCMLRIGVEANGYYFIQSEGIVFTK